MARYAIGDLQGCADPLYQLLDQVAFDPESDTLYCVGDLVNRGHQSLETLRYLRSLGSACKTVLGNHDFHFLAMAHGLREPNASLKAMIEAADLQENVEWLRSQPLLITEPETSTLFCHAGIYPWWSLDEAQKYSAEVALLLKDEARCSALLAKIYSNSPKKWNDDLQGYKRARFIINAFTRMRFCSPSGHLNLSESGYKGASKLNKIPWFKFYNPGIKGYKVVFGHWSALGLLNRAHYLGLDTGYVWGRELTLVKLPNKAKLKKLKRSKFHSVSAKEFLQKEHSISVSK